MERSPTAVEGYVAEPAAAPTGEWRKVTSAVAGVTAKGDVVVSWSPDVPAMDRLWLSLRGA